MGKVKRILVKGQQQHPLVFICDGQHDNCEGVVSD